MAFVISVYLYRDSTYAFISDPMNFGCCRIDTTFSTAWKPQMVSIAKKATAIEIFRSYVGKFSMLSGSIIEIVAGFTCITPACSTLTAQPSRCAVAVNFDKTCF